MKISLKNCFGIIATMAFILVLTGCSTEEAAPEQTSEELKSATLKLDQLGFDTSEIFEDTMNGQAGFVVERDMFFTMEQIDNMLPAVSVENNELNVEHYRTTNIVDDFGGTRVVNVYMDVDFNSTMQAAFDDALGRYNALGLDITLQRSSSANADIEILSEKLKRAPGGFIILGRSAGFPDANGDPATPIVLNSDIYNPRRGGIPADAATVIAHEIGHAIGFRHTDYMNRSFSCGQGGNEGEAGVGAVYIPGTPAGPENGSYMLACSNGTDRPFTSGDQTALTTVY